MTEITITAYGVPAPQGSKRAFAVRGKGGAPTGRVAVIESSHDRVKSWRGLSSTLPSMLTGCRSPGRSSPRSRSSCRGHGRTTAPARMRTCSAIARPPLRTASPTCPIWHEVAAKPPVKVIGYALLKFADYHDGAEIRPGVALLAIMTQQTERTVISALAKIRDWGLIWRYREGSRFGRQQLADEYRLTIPDDLVPRVPLVVEVVGLPDRVNVVHVIEAEQVNEVLVNNADHVNDVHLIAADHMNLMHGSHESDDTDQVNEVHPTFNRDLSNTSSSPGVLVAPADVEVAEPGDLDGEGGAEREGTAGNFEDHRRRELDRFEEWMRQNPEAVAP